MAPLEADAHNHLGVGALTAHISAAILSASARNQESPCYYQVWLSQPSKTLAVIAAQFQCPGVVFSAAPAAAGDQDRWLHEDGSRSPRARVRLHRLQATPRPFYLCYVKGPQRDLHSGIYGGSVYEPMSDLVYLLDTLLDSSGHILITGIYDAVAPLTEEEKKLYAKTTFNLEDYKADVGTSKLLHDTKEEVLMYRWRYPSLSIHGIEGAFSGSGSKTVIPSKIIGKFSIRLVPNMEPSVVEQQVTDYLMKKFAERNSPNKLNVTMVIGAKPWISSLNEPQYLAAQKAVRQAYGVGADMIRTGGTVPIARTLQDLTGKHVMLLGIGAADDALHSQNEKISRCNYIGGTKLYAAFVHELSKV